MRVERYRATLYSDTSDIRLHERRTDASEVLLDFESEPLSLGLTLGLTPELHTREGTLCIHPGDTLAYLALPWARPKDRLTAHQTVEIRLYVGRSSADRFYLASGYPAATGSDTLYGHRPFETVYKQRHLSSAGADPLLDTTIEWPPAGQSGYTLESVENGTIGRLTRASMKEHTEAGELEDVIEVHRTPDP